MILLICDIVSLYKSELKVQIWNGVIEGTITKKDPAVDPHARLEFWKERREYYIGKLKDRAITEITTALLSIFPDAIWKVIKKFF